MKNLFKFFIFVCIWFCLSLFIAFLISSKFTCSLQDTLFMEGITLVFISLLSSITGNCSGLSLLGIGSQNAQYISNFNLETTLKEQKYNNFKQNIQLGFSASIILVNALICILISSLT